MAGAMAWRLPSKEELVSLVDKSRTNPAINTTYFPSTLSLFYWSSTAVISKTSDAWFVGFDSGDGSYYNKSNTFYVRCVRGGQ